MQTSSHSCRWACTWQLKTVSSFLCFIFWLHIYTGFQICIFLDLILWLFSHSPTLFFVYRLIFDRDIATLISSKKNWKWARVRIPPNVKGNLTVQGRFSSPTNNTFSFTVCRLSYFCPLLGITLPMTICHTRGVLLTTFIPVRISESMWTLCGLWSQLKVLCYYVFWYLLNPND